MIGPAGAADHVWVWQDGCRLRYVRAWAEKWVRVQGNGSPGHGSGLRMMVPARALKILVAWHVRAVPRARSPEPSQRPPHCDGARAASRITSAQ